MTSAGCVCCCLYRMWSGRCVNLCGDCSAADSKAVDPAAGLQSDWGLSVYMLLGLETWPPLRWATRVAYIVGGMIQIVYLGQYCCCLLWGFSVHQSCVRLAFSDWHSGPLERLQLKVITNPIVNKRHRTMTEKLFPKVVNYISHRAS